MYHIFIHSSVSGHSGCSMSWLLWIVLLWTLGCMYLFKFEFFLDTCPGLGLLNHMVTLFSVCWRTSILFSIVAAPVYIPTNGVEEFSFLLLLLPSSLFIICRLFDDDQCNKNNKDLLYSTGNYTQHLVMTYNGKEYEKECVCVCVCIYIWITDVFLKLTQYCKSTIIQLK